MVKIGIYEGGPAAGKALSGTGAGGIMGGWGGIGRSRAADYALWLSDCLHFAMKSG